MYASSFNEQVERNNDLVFLKFHEFCTTSRAFYKKLAENFCLEKIENFKEIEEIEKFEATPKISVTQERVVNFMCYSYFSEIENKQKKGYVMMTEINKFRGYMSQEENSKLNYIILSLFEREISIGKYLRDLKVFDDKMDQKRSKVGAALSVGVRYLFKLLTNFSELREVELSEEKDLSMIVSQIFKSKKRGINNRRNIVQAKEEEPESQNY